MEKYPNALELIKPSLYGFLALIFASILNYALNIILARHLTPAAYGDYSIAFRVLVIAGSLICIGGSSAAKKFLPRYIEQNNHPYIKGLILYYLKLSFLFSLLLFLGLGVFFIIAKNHHADINHFHVVFFSLFITPLIAFSIFITGILQGLMKPTLSFLTSNVARPLLIILIFLGLIFFLQHANDKVAMVSFALALLMSCFIQISLISLYIPLKDIFRQQAKYDFSLWLSFSIPSMGSLLMALFFNALGLFMIEITNQPEEFVGLFSAIISITYFLWVVPTITSTILAPYVSQDIRYNRKEQLQGKIKTLTLFTVIINIILTLFIVIFAKSLLEFFNPTFSIGKNALIILAIGECFASLYLLGNNILRYGNNQYLIFIIMLIFLISNAALSFLFIHFFSLAGAAWSIVISSILLMLTYGYYSRKILGIKLFFIF